MVLCAVAYLLTAPGRITFPDDEIVYQTTESLGERGSFAIEGIDKRTGELRDRPSGTFGWEYGTDGNRYGFFGQGLSVVALPMYGVAKLTHSLVPETWAHAPRRDLFTFHHRSHAADWNRLVVSLTNCFITPIAAWLFGLWIVALGFSQRAAVVTALTYALATSAWPYTSTFLSEPLSAMCLVGSALCIARFHDTGHARGLWLAAALAGFSAHVHLLNVLAIPCLLGYAAAPGWRNGELTKRRRDWAIALVIGAGLLALLGLSHHLRFGSPFETGRYDHYGRFIWPWEGLAAQVIGPGRSLVLYSPPVLAALFGARRLVARVPAAAWMCLAIVAARWAFVSMRSDWYGGWGIGPRYLVAVIPFALLPLAALVDTALDGPRRRWWLGGLAASIALQGWLAAHSIFEWMWSLMVRHGNPEYFAVSHWSPGGSPLIGFFRLEGPALEALLSGELKGAVALAHLDMLPFGAVRLALVGHYSLLLTLTGIAGLGVFAGFKLWRSLARPQP